MLAAGWGAIYFSGDTYVVEATIRATVDSAHPCWDLHTPRIAAMPARTTIALAIIVFGCIFWPVARYF